MPAPYTHNYVVDTASGGPQCVAGKDYAVGDAVDTSLFLVDRAQGVLPSLFGRADIHPLSIMHYYLGVVSNHNVELHSIDETSRRVVVKAAREIKQGDVITYRLPVRPNPINGRNFVNWTAESTISHAGNGLFAGKDYKEGDTVAVNHFGTIQRTDTPITDYAFSGGDKGRLAMHGAIPVMNHSDQPNVNPYAFDHNKQYSDSDRSAGHSKKAQSFFISYGPTYWRVRSQETRPIQTVSAPQQVNDHTPLTRASPQAGRMVYQKRV